MNNQIPYFPNNQIPYLEHNSNLINNQYQGNQMNNIELEKIINKINRLEKSLRILENRINKLEINNNKTTNYDDPTDMYII